MALLIGCIILLILFVSVATISGAWPGTDTSAQILSALAGAIVAAIITLFLLLGQTSSEEKKERNTKVFEERLRIYQDFLHKLCDVVKDMKIESTEEIELEFQVAYIAMHTSTESINTISENVKKIVVKIKNEEKGSNEMLEQLFEIADVFYKELYGKDNDYNRAFRENTIRNFASIMVPKESVKQYENQRQEEIVNALNGENMTPKMRTAFLKSSIDAEGFNQFIWKDTTLVHELYTDSRNGEYIKSKNMIAVDLVPEGKDYLILVFTRQNKKENTCKLAEGIGVEFNPWEKDDTRHLYARIPQSEGETIVNTMTELLNTIKRYRDTKFKLQ